MAFSRDRYSKLFPPPLAVVLTVEDREVSRSFRWDPESSVVLDPGISSDAGNEAPETFTYNNAKKICFSASEVLWSTDGDNAPSEGGGYLRRCGACGGAVGAAGAVGAPLYKYPASRPQIRRALVTPPYTTTQPTAHTDTSSRITAPQPTAYTGRHEPPHDYRCLRRRSRHRRRPTDRPSSFRNKLDMGTR
ncbi:hypothetical protein AAG570_002191 [Ranatra chinensis]|uniref:Uncharacterized protein n=1 Tax=Ranatra chinensis TaxID=642074 RepID=A0ABD0YPL6_9HEMI